MGKSNKREIIEKAFKVFSLRVFSYGFGFLFIWILANKFGAKVQGIFSISILFLSVGVMLAKLGIETSLIKWIASARSIGSEKYIFNKALKIVILSSIFIGIIVYALAPAISEMYNKPDIKQSIQWMALGIPFLVILEVGSNFFQGRKEATVYAIYFYAVKFLFPLLFLGAFYFFEIRNYEIPSISYVIGLFFAVVLILSHIFIKLKSKEITPHFNFSTKYILTESYPMMISSSIVLIMGWSDVFILGFYVPEEQIGVYSTAVKLATIVTFVYSAIAAITTPKIAEFYNQNRLTELKETISFSSKAMVFCGLPIFVLLFIFPEFLLCLFGQEYIIGKNVLRILLIAQIMNVVTGPVGPVFQMTGHQNKLQMFIFLALALNIVVSLILVTSYGLEGVAIGSGLGMIAWNVLGAIYIFRKLKIKTWATLFSSIKRNEK